MFVRPKLEYAVSVWNPWLHKDEDVLEKVQKRLVRMLMSGQTYEETETIGIDNIERETASGRYD